MKKTEVQFDGFDRLDYYILGMLLHQGHTDPSSPVLSVAELSKRLSADGPTALIGDKAKTLEELELITTSDNYVTQNRVERENPFLCLTVKGVALMLNSADTVAGQIYGLHWDFPDEIEDSLFALRDVREPLFDAESTKSAPSVSASDRYVSVKDNQQSFDELSEQLTRIKNEYERDHNHLGAEPDCLKLLSEVEATLAQIKSGVVRLGQLAQGLIPTFEQACLGLAAYPGFTQMLGDAINTAQQILRFFGFL